MILTTSLPSAIATAEPASAPESHQDAATTTADPEAGQQESPERSLGAFNLVEGIHYVIDNQGAWRLTPKAIDRILRARDELRDEVADLEAIIDRRRAQIGSCDLQLQWQTTIAAGAREEAELAWKAESSARLGAQLWRGTALATIGAVLVLIFERLLGE